MNDETNDKYASQKKHLATKKRLMVWTSPDKLDAFKAAVEQNGTSMYAVINDFMDEYIEKSK